MIRQSQLEPRNTTDPVVGQRTIFVMLPAYNEARRLGPLLEKIGQSFATNRMTFEIILVDDGSTDGTEDIAREAAKELPVRVILHRQNKGLAAALNTGLRAAVDAAVAGDIIITMDADDTHPPNIIDRLVAAVDEGFDVAIASRYQPGAGVVGVPWSRVWLTRAASCLFRLLMPIPGVRDYTCGYRAYRYQALKSTIDYYESEFVSEPGFSCMVDVLLKMRRFKFDMAEVPFVLRYDRKEGDSKMPVGHTVWKTLTLFARRRFGGY